TVQYNRLQDLNVQFVPYEKVVTRYVEKKWRPFAGVTYCSFGYAGAGAGVFYRSAGIQVQYVTDFKRNGFSVGVMKSF
ncbi:MAG: hypothetical protein LBJ01_03335, partial [Tannerella sp.]|nr:hypothetical protein [Tannerella sp.]